MTPLEIAAGLPLGDDPGAPLLPAPGGVQPRDALDQVTLRALERVPCVVSFSGGRDSSAILAAAARAARVHGLPPPVPVTIRFPGFPAADETDWQERVVRHLGLDDWIRLELSSELDLIGPIAAAVLRRHGLIWPPNTHFHQPVLDVARGGAVLTGIDGDGVFGTWRWHRPARVLTGKVRPEPRDLVRVVKALSPGVIRRAIEGRGSPRPLPWLRPEAMAAVGRSWVTDRAVEPVRWNRWVPWYAQRRGLNMVLATFDALAADADVQAVHPFAAPEFLASLAQTGGWSGSASRTQVMRELFDDVLPEDVLARPTKARMDDAFWHRYSREFAARWDGTGVDETLVDVDALRDEWAKPLPHAAASTLIQAAWLASDGATDHEPSGL